MDTTNPNNDMLKTAVENGNVSLVRELLEKGICDVNSCQKDPYNDDKNEIETLPLLAALKSITAENDNFYQIARLLLDHENIDVNMEGSIGTILGNLCRIECLTTLGVELLLSHKDTDVNGGEYPPLYCSCIHVKERRLFLYCSKAVAATSQNRRKRHLWSRC